MKKELIAYKDPKSPVSEVFRTLRTNIQFMNSNKKLKTLLVTSTMPGEGKSWTSSNLAVAFAQAGKRVILIDADMRKGRLYNIFGVLPRPGLSNYLSGVNENDFEKNNLMNYLRETEIPNLYVMPAGNIPPNPSELLINEKMIQLLEELKRECDLIIIDGTPSKLVTDAVILSRIVDSTLIVTAHNQTKKDDFQRVIRDIKNVGGNIAGVVYNKIPVSTKKYNDTYYYAASKTQKISLKPKAEEVKEQRNFLKPKTSEVKEQKKPSKPNTDISKENKNEQPKNNKTNHNEYRRIVKMPDERIIEKAREKTENTQNVKIIINKNEEKDELPKALKNKIQIEAKKPVEIAQVIKKEQEPKTQEKTKQEKTAEVLKEYKEYLQRERNMKRRK